MPRYSDSFVFECVAGDASSLQDIEQEKEE